MHTILKNFNIFVYSLFASESLVKTVWTHGLNLNYNAFFNPSHTKDKTGVFSLQGPKVEFFIVPFVRS